MLKRFCINRISDGFADVISKDASKQPYWSSYGVKVSARRQRQRGHQPRSQRVRRTTVSLIHGGQL